MPPNSVTLRDIEGQAFDVPVEEVQSYLDRGWSEESSAERGARVTSEVQDDLYGGVGGAAKTIAAGVLSGVTLGGSDAVFGALGGRQAIKGLQAENPALNIGSNIVGAVLPAIVSGGATAPAAAAKAGIGARILAATPAGVVSKLGTKIAAKGAVPGAGVLAGVGYGAAGAAVEGALQSGGQYLAQTALEDKPLSAEGFVAAMGKGALFAAPIGGVISGASSALQRARSLFPKQEVTRDAAKAVNAEATDAIQQAVTEGDAMVAAAKQRIELIETKVGMASAGEGTTRRMFGAAPDAAQTASVPLMMTQQMRANLAALGHTPDEIANMTPAAAWQVINAQGAAMTGQAVTDQVVGAVDAAQLKDAVRKYEASKANLDDWIRNEVDPDLEAALLALEPPRVNAEMRRSGAVWPPEPSDAVGFGATSGLTAEDATRVGKTPARAPVGVPDDLLKGLAPQAAPFRPSADPTEFAKQIDQVYAGMPANEIDAVNYLSSGGYKTINPALRDNVESAIAPLMPEIKVLDQAIAKAATDSDIRVYRGLEDVSDENLVERFRSMKPGETFTDRAFVSTSTRPDDLKAYEVRMTIDVPKGTNMLPVKRSDNTLLLPRGLKFRVDSNKVVNETIAGRSRPMVEMQLSVVPSGAADAAGLGVPFRKISRPAGGSQGGAWYADEAGEQWFGKSYGGNVDRVEGEHVANRVYRLFGVDVPETKIVDIDGKRVMMSKDVGGAPAGRADVLADTNVVDGFVVDAWLANWDVAGKDFDNLIVKGRQASRVDNGGSTIWRAQGEPKTFKAPVKELESLRGPNHQSSKVFGDLSQQEIDQQLIDFADRYKTLRSDVDRIVEESKLSADAKEKIRAGLRERGEWLTGEARKLRGFPSLRPDEFGQLSKAAEQGWGEPTRAGVRDYVDDVMFDDVNDALRTGNADSLPQRWKTSIDAVDRAIAKSAAPRDMAVFRGVRAGPDGEFDVVGDLLAKLKPGDKYTDPGFHSTSSSPQVARKFAARKSASGKPNAEIQIDIPKGHPAAALTGKMTEKEFEVLLPRNTTFTVASKGTKPNGNVVLRVTMDPPTSAAVPNIGARTEPSPVPGGLLDGVQNGAVASSAPSQFRRIDREAGGSQGGAWYQDESGRHWFGKQYKGTSDRVENEHVVNQIYRMMGVSAPETIIRDVDGAKTLLSKEVKGKVASSAGELHGTDITDGFVVDAWLGNWDVVGFSFDNVIVDGGKAHRIDNGGATLWRAMGESKDFKALVSELESMRDPSLPAGRVFGKLSQQQIDSQLRMFAERYAAKRQAVDALIDASGLTNKAKEQIKTGLHDRAEWLRYLGSSPARQLADDEFNGLAELAQETLTYDEAQAALAYSRNGLYAIINGQLRRSGEKVGGSGLKQLDKAYHQTVKELDSGMQASPAPRDMLLYRGVSQEEAVAALEKLKPGDTFVDPGFVSTSYLPNVGSDFSKGFGVREGIELHITVPEGYPALAIPSDLPNEREILLPRGGKFTVFGVDTADDGHKILRVSVREPDPVAARVIPTGFDLTAKGGNGQPIFNENPDIAEGIPEFADITPATARDVAYVVRPSQLAEAGILGKPGVAADAWVGSDIPAVTINVHRGPSRPGGGYATLGYSIDDGTKRVLAAAKDGDRPIIVRFWPAWSEPYQVVPISDDIRKALPNLKPNQAAPEAPAVTEQAPTSYLESIARIQRDVAGMATKKGPSLEELLRGTKAQLDAGATLGQVSAASPLRKAYVIGKELDSGRPLTGGAVAMAHEGDGREGFAQFQRRVANDATNVGRVHAAPPAASASAADDGSLEALLRGTKAHLDAGGDLKSARRAAPSADDGPTGLEGLLNAQRRVAGDMTLVRPGMTFGTAERTANDNQIWAALQRNGIDGPPPSSAGIGQRVMASATPAEQVAKIIAKRSGGDVDIGPSLEKAARAIGDFEAAGADLVRVLGPAAPAGAQARAKAYQAATAGQADAAAAAAAKVAATVNAKAPLPAATGGGLLSKLADAGTAIEALSAMGVRTPSLGSIPVIGPLLSLFFKARAVMGIVGRKGGSIGKSVEGTVAERAAQVRNRIRAATTAALTVSARGAKRAAAASGGVAGVLAYKLFPGGDEPKSKDVRALYDARMSELARAQAPRAIADAVAERYPTSDAALQDAITAQVERGLRFLDSKAPKRTTMPGMLKSDGKWYPSKVALEKWARYVEAVNDPAKVLEDLAKGHVTIEGAETLRVVYPRLFAEAQRALLEAAPQIQQTLPYSRRVMLSIMFRVPVDGSMTPENLQFLQPQPPAGDPAGAPTGVPAPAPAAGPAFSGPLSLGQQTMTSLDRRAGM